MWNNMTLNQNTFTMCNSLTTLIEYCTICTSLQPITSFRLVNLNHINIIQYRIAWFRSIHLLKISSISTYLSIHLPFLFSIFTPYKSKHFSPSYHFYHLFNRTAADKHLFSSVTTFSSTIPPSPFLPPIFFLFFLLSIK